MYIANLKKLRKQKNVSQAECSLVTGIPLRTLQRYENGENIGDIEYLFRLMDYFKLEPSDLSQTETEVKKT